jgi:hypothetical protein
MHDTMPQLADGTPPLALLLLTAFELGLQGGRGGMDADNSQAFRHTQDVHQGIMCVVGQAEATPEHDIEVQDKTFLQLHCLPDSVRRDVPFQQVVALDDAPLRCGDREDMLEIGR